MQQPNLTRDQLIAAERAAEQAVVEAEALYQRTLPSDPGFTHAAIYLDRSRKASLALRELMTVGLAWWTDVAERAS
jgi:hypothetical protein